MIVNLREIRVLGWENSIVWAVRVCWEMRLAEGSETWLLLFMVEPHTLVEVVPVGSHLSALLLLTSIASRWLRCES